MADALIHAVWAPVRSPHITKQCSDLRMKFEKQTSKDGIYLKCLQFLFAFFFFQMTEHIRANILYFVFKV